MIRLLLAAVAGLAGLILASPIVILGMPFWAVAFLTRNIAGLAEREVASWDDLIEYEPTIGWKPRASLDVSYVVEREGVYRVTTDAQGWPGRTSIRESDVLVLGDSFAFGYAINAGSSFAELVPELRIKAIGANGYNMVQELL